MHHTELEERIRQAFAEEPRPVPDAGMAEIAARRARGERVALVGAARRPFWWTRWALVGAAAGLLGWLGLRGTVSSPSREATVVDRLANAALAPDPLFAQGSAHPSFPVAQPSGPELRPGEWSFATLEPGGSTAASWTRTTRLARVEYHGRQVWRFTSGSDRASGPLGWRDTSWLDPETLKPIARVSRVSGGAVITEEYRDDAILTGYTSNGSTTWRSITIDTTGQITSGIRITSDLFLATLKRAPLNRDWKGSIQLLGIPNGDMASRRWFDLGVVGEERITVPAGTFDCWKIRFLRYRDDRPDIGYFFWVSQREQWIVQQGGQGVRGPGFRTVLVAAREE